MGSFHWQLSLQWAVPGGIPIKMYRGSKTDPSIYPQLHIEDTEGHRTQSPRSISMAASNLTPLSPSCLALGSWQSTQPPSVPCTGSSSCLTRVTTPTACITSAAVS